MKKDYPTRLFLKIIATSFEEDVLDLIESLNGNFNNKKSKYTGDDEKRQKEEDFGNRWTDWSPDLNDYLEWS